MAVPRGVTRLNPARARKQSDQGMRQVVQPVRLARCKAYSNRSNRSNGGLPKGPVNGAVMLHALGIAGDRQRNLKYHGWSGQSRIDDLR